MVPASWRHSDDTYTETAFRDWSATSAATFQIRWKTSGLCVQLMREFGLTDCRRRHTHLRQNRTVLSVKRFDRRWNWTGRRGHFCARNSILGQAQWIARLPQEDFCQATGRPPTEKYEADGGPTSEEYSADSRGQRIPGFRPRALRARSVWHFGCWQQPMDTRRISPFSTALGARSA